MLSVVPSAKVIAANRADALGGCEHSWADGPLCERAPELRDGQVWRASAAIA